MKPKKKRRDPARQQVRRVVPWYVKALGVALSLALFIGGSEIILRLSGKDFFYRNQFFPINRDINFAEIYKKDARLFWRFRQNFDTESELYSNINYHINSMGLRGPEIDETTNGLRILALGNSCTFGWGVKRDETWVSLTEEILRSKYSDSEVEIINAGVPGYTTYQGKLFYTEELADLSPDIVLFMFGWNDHWPAGKDITDSQQRLPNVLILEMQNVLSRLKLYQLLRSLLLSSTETQERVAIDDLAKERRVPRTEFIENLKQLTAFARDHSTIPILISPPMPSQEKYTMRNMSQLAILHGMYQQDIISVAKSDSVPLVDLQAAFATTVQFFDDPGRDPVHFNVAGHKQTARAVAEAIGAIMDKNQTR